MLKVPTDFLRGILTFCGFYWTYLSYHYQSHSYHSCEVLDSVARDPSFLLYFFIFSLVEWARKLSAVSLFSTSRMISEYNFNFVRRKCWRGPRLRRFTFENSLVTLFSTFLNFCYWNYSIVTSHYTNNQHASIIGKL